MGRRQEVYVVKLTHACDPDPDARERGLRMWAAFLAENRRRKTRPDRKTSRSGQVG